MDELLEKLGGTPAVDNKNTSKSPEGGGSKNKISDVKQMKFKGTLPEINTSTEHRALLNELRHVGVQVDGQTTMPMSKILFGGSIYAYGLDQIMEMNKIEMEGLLNDFKSADDVSTGDALAKKESFMSYYPDGDIITEMSEMSTSFDKVYALLTTKLGADSKSPSEAGQSELLLAVAKLGEKAIELYGLQMEYESKLLKLASETQNILKFESMEGRYNGIPNWNDTFERIKRESSRVKPWLIDMLRSDDPLRGQTVLFNNLLCDSPQNVADHVLNLGCSINKLFSVMAALCKPAEGSTDWTSTMTDRQEKLKSTVRAMQHSKDEVRLDTVVESFGVKAGEYLAALEDDDSAQARAMKREMGDDVSVVGLFLTYVALMINLKREVEGMSDPAAREFVTLVEKVQTEYGEDGIRGPGKSKSPFFNTMRWNGVTGLFVDFSNNYQPDARNYSPEAGVVTESAMMTTTNAADGSAGGGSYADAAKTGGKVPNIDGDILKAINDIKDPEKRFDALMRFSQNGGKGAKEGTKITPPFKMAFLHCEGPNGERQRVCNYCGDGTNQGPHQILECFGRVVDIDNKNIRHMASTAKEWFDMNGKKIGVPRPFDNDQSVRDRMAQEKFVPGMPHGDRCYTCREVIFAEAKNRALPKSQRQYGGRGGGRGRGGYQRQSATAYTAMSVPSTGQQQSATQTGQPATQTVQVAAQPDAAGAGNQMTEMHAMLVKLNDRVSEVQSYSKKTKKNRKKPQIDWSADDTEDDTDDEQ